MPEGDEVAEPREVFWAEAKQSPEQKEGRGTSQVDGKMEAQTKSGEQERGEGANQPYVKASPILTLADILCVI